MPERSEMRSGGGDRGTGPSDPTGCIIAVVIAVGILIAVVVLLVKLF